MQDLIRIGTRKSRLALVQTNIVRQKIEKAFPGIRVEICEMSTKGDELLDRTLTSFGGKGVFTQELEEALLEERIDMAVHSAKDMPMDFPEGLGIGAALKRGPVEDVVVTKDGTKLSGLKPGSVVGTGSLRRELQIRELNPLAVIRPIRGNVQTRLKKLSDGLYDAIVLASAGLERLDMVSGDEFHFEKLSPDQCLPAAGQAILAVETKNGHLTEVMEALNDTEAMAMLRAERAYLKAIGGSCNAPAAALAKVEGTELSMEVLFAQDAKHVKRTSGSIKNGIEPEQAEALGQELARKICQGKVWLVGAGPGDERLVTRRCLSCIRGADVLVYDSLATDSLLNEARPDAELIYAGKRSSHHHLKQEETNALLIRLAKDGKNVVRLKGGDPFIFGRGGEEAQELREAGVEYEIVPGVSSCYGAPAYAGIPVTHRDHASSFHVVTGHEGAHKDSTVLDYGTLAKEEGTLVFLMGLKNLPNITKNLIAKGKNPKTPAAVVQEGTTARQKVAVGTVETIVEEAEKAGIQTPAITVIGDVVSLRDEISWYGRQPLSGKRVLVTATERMTEHLAEVLEEEGAEAIRFSLIHTEALESPELDRLAAHPEQYSWMVFTSSNGVELFFEKLLAAGKDFRSLANLKFAVVGEGTAEALAGRGFLADFVPTKYTSRTLAKEWVPTLQKDDRVVLVRAEEASKELDQALSGAGIAYSSVPMYHTAVDLRKAEELRRMISQVDYVTLCSGSAVRAFASMLEEDGVRVDCPAKIVCIGPVTEKAAVEAGLTVGQSAVEYTAEGIKNVLLADVITVQDQAKLRPSNACMQADK